MNMNRTINLLILEHNDIAFEQLKRFYGTIFKRFGMNPNYILRQNPKGTIIETKKNNSVFDENIIDVFICDLSLGDKMENFIGLEVIQDVKRLYPELLIIANSYQNIRSRIIYDLYPSFDLFVDKTRFSENDYSDYIKSKIEKLFNRNISLTIDYEASKFPNKFNINRKTQKKKLENLLKNITFTTINSEVNTTISNVTLEYIDSGESSSNVFKMKSYFDNGLENIASIIKISDKRLSKQERDNYINYVKWNLPYNWRVELMAYSEWQELGCLCYTFAESVGEIRPITYFIKHQNITKINRIIETIFNPNNLRWYHGLNVKIADSITEYYVRKWFTGANGRRRKVPNQVIENLLQTKNIRFNTNYIILNSRKIPMPDNFYIKERGRFYTSIVHGDMNSNNVMIGENSPNPVFIDFQDTGRGHIFQDFIVFENSIRLYGDMQLDFKDLFELELAMHYHFIGKVDKSGIPNISSVFIESIIKLRKSALETFEEGKYTSYAYGLLMSCYSRLRKADYLNESVKNQMLACLLASIYFLDEIKDKDVDVEEIQSPVKEEKTGRPNKVFISYNAAADREFVRDIVNKLKMRGVDTWYDDDRIEPGNEIISKIGEGISLCKTFVVVLNESGKGDWQKKEINDILVNAIYDDEIKIVPVIPIDSKPTNIPTFLKSYRYINFNPDFARAFEQLIKSVQN